MSSALPCGSSVASQSCRNAVNCANRRHLPELRPPSPSSRLRPRRASPRAPGELGFLPRPFSLSLSLCNSPSPRASVRRLQASSPATLRWSKSSGATTKWFTVVCRVQRDPPREPSRPGRRARARHGYGQSVLTSC